MNNLVDKLADMLNKLSGSTTTFRQDAEFIIKGLKADGYNISNNNSVNVWKDATNISVEGWVIVIYKRYCVRSNEFDYYPKLLRGYSSDDDLIKGETRAHLLCEITLPV
jgi:hypothetical protein